MKIQKKKEKSAAYFRLIFFGGISCSQSPPFKQPAITFQMKITLSRKQKSGWWRYQLMVSGKRFVLSDIDWEFHGIQANSNIQVMQVVGRTRVQRDFI